MFILNSNFENLCFLKPTNAVVSEDLNGKFELFFEHFFDKENRFESIQNDNIVLVNTPKNKQYFRIYKVVKNLKTIRVNARHIFYDLLNTNININVFGSAKAVLQKLTQNISNFTFLTNIDKESNIFVENENIVKAFLGNDAEKPKFIQSFGGEILRDNFNIRILENIGADRGFTISYGKNMTELTLTEDFSDICTKVIAFGENISLELESEYINKYAFPKVHVVNFSTSSQRELRKMAEDYLKTHEIPKINIVVNFVFLKNTTKYKDYAFLEEVFLGDYVNIYNKNLNILKSAKVIGYEFDCISKKYNKVILGDFQENLANTINSNNSFARNVNFRVQNLNETLQNANSELGNVSQSIEKINTTLNGFIKIIDENLYILDNSDIEKATVVYRFNSEGIAKSVNGINGEFIILIN